MILERHKWYAQVENMSLLNLCSKLAVLGLGSSSGASINDAHLRR